MYGIKINDNLGKSLLLTPSMGIAISAGRITMPSSLVDTNKYYATVSLPYSVSVDNLSVLLTPVKWNMRVNREVSSFSYYYSVGYNWQSAFLDSSYTYYSKTESTGVMTLHTAGNKTVSNPSTWHHVITAFPIVYWEKLGETTVSDVKIFAATAYCVNITSTTSYSVTPTTPISDYRYSIYTDGVETVDYVIFIKNYEG